MHLPGFHISQPVPAETGNQRLKNRNDTLGFSAAAGTQKQNFCLRTQNYDQRICFHFRICHLRAV